MFAQGGERLRYEGEIARGGTGAIGVVLDRALQRPDREGGPARSDQRTAVEHQGLGARIGNRHVGTEGLDGRLVLFGANQLGGVFERDLDLPGIFP